jgi:hypothetical protein
MSSTGPDIDISAEQPTDAPLVDLSGEYYAAPPPARPLAEPEPPAADADPPRLIDADAGSLLHEADPPLAEAPSDPPAEAPTDPPRSPALAVAAVSPAKPDTVFAPTQVPASRSDALDDALMLMVTHRVLPAPHLRAAVCSYGRTKSARLMLSEAYDEAAAIDLAVDVLFVSMREAESAQACDSQTAALRERLEKCQGQAREIEAAGGATLEQRRAEGQWRLAQLLEWHAAERVELEREWARPAARVPFTTPSPQLLQIRRQQKYSALLHDFENAKAMKLQAEVMEAKEGAEAARRFAAASLSARQQLLDRQQREVGCLPQKSKFKADVIAAATGGRMS